MTHPRQQARSWARQLKRIERRARDSHMRWQLMGELANGTFQRFDGMALG